jgi:hypothetical protein
MRHRILELDPDSYNSWHNLATDYVQIGAPELGRAWYDATPPEAQTDDYLPGGVFVNPEGFDRMVELGERNMRLYPGWNGGERSYVHWLIDAGRFEEAAEKAAEYETALTNTSTGGSAAEAAVIARRVGQDVLADRLMAHARDRHATLVETGYLPASERQLRLNFAMESGDLDGAVEVLREGIEAGRRNPAHLQHSAYMNPVRDHPGYQALLADLDAELARQRAELEAEGLMAFPEGFAP